METEKLNPFLNAIEGYEPILVKAAIVVLITIIASLVARQLQKQVRITADRRSLPKNRTDTLSKLATALIAVTWVVIVSNVLGFGIQGIFLATSSFFAIVGVAFFATWSILSNITSSLILYFAFPFKVGDKIEFSEADTPSGELVEMTLFYLKIRTTEGHIVSVPSNVAIQKIIKKSAPKPATK